MPSDAARAWQELRLLITIGAARPLSPADAARLRFRGAGFGPWRETGETRRPKGRPYGEGVLPHAPRFAIWSDPAALERIEADARRRSA